MVGLIDEFEIAEEVEEEAYVEYDIATYPSDYTLDVLQQMKDRDDIIIPEFQRSYVWNIKQASLLVESFLLGLPVPPLFLYINEQNKSEVIDGQQRLLSMLYFMEGYFGEADAKGKRTVFKLQGLSDKSPFRNKTFETLEERHQRKLRSSVLRAINIRQLTPVGSNTSVFHIFERLNTGGTRLTPQEIRNAVFRGEIVNALKLLNKLEAWQKILGLKKPDKNQRDVELVLRLFALFEKWDDYEKPMKEYLNKKMKASSAFDSPDAKRFQERFKPSIDKIVAALGPKPFRPKRVINAAVLEAVTLTVLESPNLTVEQIRENYVTLMGDETFIKVIGGATTDTKQVKDRLTLARQHLLA